MEKKNSVIVVIGAGRSGTSMTMQILEALGLSVSRDTLSVGEQNPLGAYEDREIYEATREFYSQLGINQSMPLPEKWLDSVYAEELIDKLLGRLNSEIESSESTYCVKDPKSTQLLPLWTQVFNMARVTPKYILTVRDPVAVCSSMIRQYNYSSHMAELYWLNHNVTALWDCGSNCFISHYEDWFADPGKALKALVSYLEISDRVDDEKLDSVIENVIKARLNRSRYSDYEVKNRYVGRLYGVLKDQRGYNFENEKLMETVKECRQVMTEFSGWPIAAYSLLARKQEKIDDREKKIERLEQRIKGLESDLESIVRKSNGYLMEVKDLRSTVDNKDIALRAVNEKLEEIETVDKEQLERLQSIEYSKTYLFGRIFFLALKKPGMNTVLLPYRLFKLFYGKDDTSL